MTVSLTSKRTIEKSRIIGILCILLALFYLSVLPAVSQELSHAEQFEQGRKLFAAGELEAAYQIFFKLFKKNPGDNEINFELGRVSFAKGDYESAIMAFERILIMDPKATRVKLEIARCHLNLGSKETAKQLFQEVLDTNPPANVRKNIENFLSAIRRSEKWHFFSGLMSTSIAWDNNAATAPSDTTIPISSSYDVTVDDITDDITTNDFPDITYTVEAAKEDLIYNNYLVINYTLKVPDSCFSWKNSAIAYNATYNDNKDLNLNYFSGTSGPQFQGKKMGLNIYGIATHLLLEEKEYMTSFGAGTDLSFIFFSNYIAGIGFKWELKNYVGQIPIEKDANNYSITTNHVLSFAKILINLKVDGELEEAEKKYNSYKRIRPSLILLYHLPFDINITGSYSYQYTKYDKEDPSFHKIRLDDLHTYNAGISKKNFGNLKKQIAIFQLC